eukprot:jgi/Botrbrau1/12089/Bobra.0186s0013.1
MDAVENLPPAEEQVDVDVQKFVLNFFKEDVLPRLPRAAGKGARPAVAGNARAVVNFIFRLPNPTIDTMAESFGQLPESFACCNAELVVLGPQLFWPQHFECPHCPKCKKKGGVTGNGWSSYVRRVAGLARVFYLIQYRWRCGKCPGHDNKQFNFQFLSSMANGEVREGIISQLDTPKLKFILDQLPFVLTARGAVAKELLDLISSNVLNGMSFHGSSLVVKEMQTLSHYRAQAQFLQFHVAMEQKSRGTLFSRPMKKVPYVGQKHTVYAPSPQYLASLYLTEGQSRRDFLKLLLGNFSGRFWRLDWTFRDTKYIRDASGQRVFQAVFTIMNEHGELVLQLFTVTADNFEEIKCALAQLRAHIITNSLQMPEFVWVDNVLKFEKQIQSVFPDLKVLQDVYHVLARYSKLIPDSHCLKGPFVAALSDAMLIPNEQDRRDVIKYYKGKGISQQETVGKSRSWWKKRIRYSVPGPHALAERVKQVVAKFRGKRDPRLPEGLNLLITPEMEDVHANQIDLMLMGYMSDPLVEMYINVNPDAKGLPKYITVRGTSKLEAYHRHLHAVLDGANNSPVMADALVFEFNYR